MKPAHAFLIALIVLSCPVATRAATFDVDSQIDEPDANPGNEMCVSTPSGVCTLRAAIEEANVLVGDDIIMLPVGDFILTRAGRNENAANTGDLDVQENVTIYGQGMDATIIDANGLDRVFELLGGTLELVGLTVRGGRAIFADTYLGGGIRAGGNLLSIGGCRLTDNVANLGGAISGSFVTNIEIADSLLDGNAVQALGYANPYGAAVRAEGGLALENTTVSGNTTSSLGYYAVDAHCDQNDVYVLNSTIAGNQASGFYAYNCDVTILHATIADNGGVGVLIGDFAGTHDYVVGNSVIAGNGSNDCFLAEDVVFDHCLDSDNTCGLSAAAGDLPGTDPVLLPLRDWGGPTPTMYPKPMVSPVVDVGNGAVCYITDQRGEVRGGDGDGDGTPGCDMGAVEAGDLVFYDSLEGGDTTEWSGAVGLPP